MALLEEYEKQGRGLSKYGKAIPFTALILSYALLLKGEIYPNSFYFQESRAEELYENLCLLFSFFGFVVYAYALGTSTALSGKKIKGRVAESYHGTGLYSVVRHPKFIGMVIMWMGPALMTGFLWFEIAYWLFCWLYFERIMFAEEMHIRNQLSSNYRNLTEKIPAFIPNIFLFRKSQTFNWRKALLKENNQFTYVVMAFFIFDFCSEMIDGKPQLNKLLSIVLIITFASNIALSIYKRLEKTSGMKKTGSQK